MTLHIGPLFSVSVQAGFAEDGVWSIDARLRFRDGKTPPIGSSLLADGHIALLKGIHREGILGRSLGATQVRLCMDAGDGPFDLVSDGTFRRVDTVH